MAVCFFEDALARVLLHIMSLELSMRSGLLINLCLITRDSLSVIIFCLSLMERLNLLSLVFVLLVCAFAQFIVLPLE